MTHTKAPWKVFVDEEDASISVKMASCLEDNDVQFAAHDIKLYDCAYDEDYDYDECMANADLIAAAPDLLEALTLLWSWATNGHDIRLAILTDKMVGDIVKKAILKAEGKEDDR